jgi:hypothetical protein
MRRLSTAVVAAVFSALLGACSLTTECRVTGVFGLRLIIEDSITGQATGDSAIATAADSAAGYIDTLRIAPGSEGRTPEGRARLFIGVVDRPGTYTIHVRKPGYLDWTATSVQLAEGACGVEPLEVLARLVRAP